MTTTIRTRIRALTDNLVSLTYEDETGEVRTREFTVVGSDVREIDANMGRPVHYGLSGGGYFLPVGRDGLLATIRREYRAMRRAEAARWA